MAKWAQFYIARRAGQTAAAPTPRTDLATTSTTVARRADSRPETGGDLDVPSDDEALDDVIDLDNIDEGDIADEVDDVLDEVGEEVGDGDLDEFDEPDLTRPHVPDDCREAVDLDHRTPIEVGGGAMRLALSPQMPPKEARQYVRRFLAELHQRDVRRFKKEDVGADLLAAVGYRASWLDKVLAEFAGEEPAWLVRTDERGWYDIVALPAPALERHAA